MKSEIVLQRFKTTKIFQKFKQPVRRAIARVGYDVVVSDRPESQQWLAMMNSRNVEVMVDVGANQGQYAEEARRRGFAGQIFSFEPASAPFSRLETRSQSDEHWVAFQSAVGSSSGEVTLNLSANSVSSSLLVVSSEHVTAEPASRMVGTERVRQTTLDSEYDFGTFGTGRSCMLKIDVQGAERAVLDGAVRFLDERCVLIQTELSTRTLYEGQLNFIQISGLLYNLGFELIDIYPGFRNPKTGELLQFDGFFTRRRQPMDPRKVSQ